MTADSPIIIRVYNNNLVLARESAGNEVLLMGRALGYAQHPGDPVKTAQVEMRFIPQDESRSDRLANSLTGASMAEARLGQEIVELAHTELGLPVSQALQLAVIDHLVFAVRRARAAEPISIPLNWEVRQLYPREVEVGQMALRMVEDELVVSLPPDEAVAFALHFVSAQLSSPNMSQTMAMTTMIATVWEIVTKRFPIDLNSLAASRFVIHLQHLFNRMQSKAKGGIAPKGLMAIVTEAHPEALVVAKQVADALERDSGRPIAEDEMAYLAIHIGRLWTEVEQSADFE